jgi:lipoprotein-anchoring transpeptidase ErfK/SrfK
MTKQLTLILAAIAILLVSACAQLPSVDMPVTAETKQQAPATSADPEPESLYEWSGHGRTVSNILIDLDAQKAFFYDGPEQIGWTMIATGMRFYSTPRGRFKITQKVADKRSNLYGNIYDSNGKLAIVNARQGVHRIPPGGRFEGAEMPHFMRLTDSGVGIHAGSIPEPGSPASHGCVRMPDRMAAILFHHVRVGTPVSVIGERQS